MKQPRTGFLLALLAGGVLLLYYPTLAGAPNSIDDYKMLMDVELGDGFSLTGLLRPGPSLYYRPLLMASFWLDKAIWRLEPSFMLLENILFHAGSTILVFLLGRRLPVSRGAPLLAALLFAVHPLATESLNWISGRTDPMATFFHLLAAWTLLAGGGRPLALVFAVVASGAGVLSKEMSFVFVPANALLFLCFGTAPRRHRLWTAGAFLAPFLAAGGLALAYRQLHFGTHLPLPDLQPTTAISQALTAFGFYVKKLFWPVPLNFAIATVADTYFWLGATALAFLCLASRPAYRRHPTLPLLGIAALLTIPAVILALARVAWTPYAERYAYQAMPFFCLGLAAVPTRHRLSRPLTAAALTLVALAATATWQRNLLWQDKVAFFTATVAQSPAFATVRNELAVALLQAGRDAEAVAQLQRGIELDRRQPSPRNQVLYANLAMYHLQHGDPDKGAAILQPLIATDLDGASPQVLATHAEILQSQWRRRPDLGPQLGPQLLTVYQTLATKEHDPFYTYLAAKTAARLGRDDAATLFAAAARRAPATAAYRRAAAILARRHGHSSSGNQQP